MEELENVVETENTEQPVEQVESIELTDTTPTRTYTDEDVDRIIAKKLARQEAKIVRQYEEQLSKYKQTEEVLKAGLGTSSIDEANERLAEFYKEQGVEIPVLKNASGLSSKEIEILAKAEAEEIIDLGFSEMEEEANRLAAKGYDNLNVKEKAIFNTLAEKLTNETKRKELAQNGIKTDILDSKDFKEFSAKFNPKTSVVEIYNLYSKTTQPKEEVKPIGSMATTEVNKVKDFYTMDEINALSSKDYDDPAVMQAVEKSLAKIYKDSHS